MVGKKGFILLLASIITDVLAVVELGVITLFSTHIANVLGDEE